jgi:hypothetical protein
VDQDVDENIGQISMKFNTIALKVIAIQSAALRTQSVVKS